MTTLIQRLKKLEKNPNGSNCAGTALFLSGEQEADIYVAPKDVYELYLSKLEEIKSPEIGCLIAWEKPNYESSRYISHLGIVSQTIPLKVTSRKEFNEKVEEDKDVKNYNNYLGRIRFYLPTELAKERCLSPKEETYEQLFA